jgi:hypothetical protein
MDVSAAGAEIVESSDPSYPSVLGENNVLGAHDAELWRDYLGEARLRRVTPGDFRMYKLAQPRSSCEYFLNDLAEVLGETSRDKKSVSTTAGDPFGKYTHVAVRNLGFKVGRRVLWVDVWQSFEEVDPKHFIGKNPTGRFRIDIRDSQKKLYGHSDMSRTKNGQLSWTVTPELPALEKDGPQKYFDVINDVLNQLTET